MRNAKIILIIGAIGSGKTTFTKKLFEQVKSNSKLIIDDFDNPVWRTWERYDYPEGKNIPIPIIPIDFVPRLKSGVFRCKAFDISEVSKAIKKGLMNSCILFEDATKYFEGNIDDATKSLMIDCKQKSIDLVFVFHGMADVPPKIARRAHIVQLFKTYEAEVPKKKFPQADFKIAFDYLKDHPDKFKNVTIVKN